MSIFDHPDSVQPAPSWRCPRCRTLQPEAVRCWRCETPAFSCQTCHRYRPSVAAGLGYCADDATHTPLRADETRTCWESAGTPVLGALAGAPGDDDEGLFPAADIRPSFPGPSTPVQRAPSPGVRGSTLRREKPTPKPPLEVPGRAAWAEPGSDALVEAPEVQPGKRLTTEVERRRGRWLR